MKHDLSEDEWELILAIRNFRSSYPNGQFNLDWHAQDCFNKLMTI
ncbi:MAG: ArsR family transcriptional regulator [Bacteroidaceae bacterium]|nr:ArsR family transcriptional regulator [Bacteroidaceae bacterium]